MKNSRRWITAFVFAFVVAVTAILIARPRGPSYGGKSINKWFYAVGDFRAPPDPEADRAAFRAMGSNAVPFLIARLQAAPSERIREALARIWTPASEIYRQRKQMWQSRAAFLLGEMGPLALAAEPILVQSAATGFWAVQGEAKVALMKIRQESPDTLIEKLNDTSDWRAWYENAMMVGEFGARAEPAVPILLQALQHTNNIIQAHALIALGMISRQPEKCVPAILPFMNSRSVSDRQKAIGALRSFGSNAFSAKPAIEKALNDNDPWVRRQAELALKNLPMSHGADRKP